VHLTNEQPDSFKLTRESQLFLQELVKELNAAKPDFIMFGGDQVETVGKDETNWQLFLDVVQGLNSPWAFVLGETDVSGNYPVDKRKTFGPDWKQCGIDTETPYWSHNLSQLPNVHLVGLDTSIPNTTIGGVSAKQLEWLKADLEANKKSFTIVFSHHPLLPPPPYDSGPPWDEYIIPDGGSVREIIGAYPNVKMVLSGHTYVSRVQSEGEVWHISSPALAVYPCAYRIFHVTPNMVTMETRQIGFPALVKKGRKELADSALATRYSKNDPGSFLAVAEGGREDQNALIPMAAGKPLQPYNPKKASKQEAQQAQEEKPKKKKKKHEESAPPTKQEPPKQEAPKPDAKLEAPKPEPKQEEQKDAEQQDKQAE
jgi:hypothetical protein